jgi:hypothetical protein
MALDLILELGVSTVCQLLSIDLGTMVLLVNLPQLLLCLQSRIDQLCTSMKQQITYVNLLFQSDSIFYWFNVEAHSSQIHITWCCQNPLTQVPRLCYSHYEKVLVIRSGPPLANSISNNKIQCYTTTNNDTAFKPKIQRV